MIIMRDKPPKHRYPRVNGVDLKTGTNCKPYAVVTIYRTHYNKYGSSSKVKGVNRTYFIRYNSPTYLRVKHSLDLLGERFDNTGN